ncbi:hypothetical protein COV18_00085 [Candidatus Woesearchaeota archaeon CG10_big_fil_rev_8_21_14_0_10_37_12]|nr:MAG: hypothetical protein COV18_00085 [Candidatus Woesearchaeota archaeon CG10_big_fil_rev_8_21_14_0_10_37_12]
MNYDSVLKGVLPELVPSDNERKIVSKEVNKFLVEINAELKKKKLKATAVLGGSYAKNVWLAGDYDVDMFVKFNVSHKSDDLSNLLESVLKKWKPERIHGSRDYFWIKNKIKYEIIPVLDIKQAAQAENVTDFSPKHVDWVNKNGKKLKNDIRLAKKFCKAAKCYGAESYIRGFSGHVIDILVIYNKGFLQLLKAAIKWKPKVVLDYNKVHQGRAVWRLNKSKTEGPLVLVDPVQPERNAAAALTRENFDKFVSAAKQFLKKPSVDFFVEQPLDISKLKKKGYLIALSVTTVDAKEDVAGTKFVRAFEFVRDNLVDFNVIDAVWQWDKESKGNWFFVVKKTKLSEFVDHKGPPVKMKDAVKEFKKAHKKTFTKAAHIWTKVKRDAITPEEKVKLLIKDEYVKSRVGKITW